MLRAKVTQVLCDEVSLLATGLTPVISSDGLSGFTFEQSRPYGRVSSTKHDNTAKQNSYLTGEMNCVDYRVLSLLSVVISCLPGQHRSERKNRMACRQDTVRFPCLYRRQLYVRCLKYFTTQRSLTIHKCRYSQSSG